MSVLFLWVSLMSGGAWAWAGTISLETSVTASAQQGTLRASVTVTNRGDEAAHDVRVTAELQGLSWSAPVESPLAVQQPRTVTFAQPVGDLAPGLYPLIVRVHYTDANRYPFSALTVTEFTVGQHVTPDLLAILNPITMRHQGTMALRLKNLAPQARTVTIRAVLPHELSAEPSSMKQELAAHQEAQVSFRVKNFSALSGSTYPVYAVIEHDQEGRHATAVATALVQIEAGTWWRHAQRLWAVLAGLLFCALVILNVRPGWRHQQPRARAGG